MRPNSTGKPLLPENQLVLYISDQSPGTDWVHLAMVYNWEINHHDDLFTALGAFIMFMPGIVIIDRRSQVGHEVLPHIEDVLPTIPQPLLIVIELGVPECIVHYGSVLRLGASSDTSPANILMRIQVS